MTRTIKIHPVLNGYVVTVGCQTVCFNTIEEVCSQLTAYAKTMPEAYEAGFIASAVNKDLAKGAMIPEPCPAPTNSCLGVGGQGWGSAECAAQTDRPRDPARR